MEFRNEEEQATYDEGHKVGDSKGFEEGGDAAVALLLERIEFYFIHVFEVPAEKFDPNYQSKKLIDYLEKGTL